MKKKTLNLAVFVLAVIMGCISFTSCGEDSKTIEDEKLAGYLVGGVYVYDGYGDAGNALIKQMESYVPEGANFTKRLHSAYNEIMINPFSDIRESDLKRGLSDWWDVNDKDDLSEMIESLRTGRHSVRFQKIYDAVKQAGGKSANLDEITVEDADEEQIQFVAENFETVSPTGIKAWDYARAANLIFDGEALKWLTIEEGEQLLAKLLSTVRENYSDWNTYHKDFELGRRFWAGDPENNTEFTKLVDLLTSDNEYVIYNYLPLKK